MIYQEFIETGFRIFPLWDFDPKKQKCHCSKNGCSAPGKHPRTTNWQHTPAWSEEKLEEMETSGEFSSGYGVLCGNLLVIDVDARNGGVPSYAKLLKDIPEIAGSGLVVETGSGGGSKHLYFELPEAMSLVTKHKDYPGIDFKSSGFVVGPGSHHASGNLYKVLDGSPYDISKAPEGLLKKLEQKKKHRTEYEGHAIDVSQSDLSEILDNIPNNDADYEDWVTVGMAIHDATGGSGEALWYKWSGRSGKHDDADMEKKWYSFGKAPNPVTIGTLIYRAQQNGWQMPMAYYPNWEEGLREEAPAPSGLPFDIAGVDHKAPPGIVGQLAKWIESQSRRPRENIAVAAALTALGNVIGLRFIDARDGVSGNLFTFCVAGSRTGKESVNQAVATVHRVAGISAASHGAMKSEQEVIKNLIRHQAAFYVIDEIGIFLKKVKNAQSRGGAAYLEGLMGILMSVYSKADGYLLVTGDTKEDMRQMLTKELSQVRASLEDEPESRWLNKRLTSVEKGLSTLDDGLRNPFLSIIGFTTPVTFDEVVDFENATNGFIGRALLFQERDTAPRSKVRTGFVKPELPFGMDMTIRSLAMGDDFDLEGGPRVEFFGEKVKVHTDPKAEQMLQDALDWFEDQAIMHKDITGLEALYLGGFELMAKVSFILAAPERLRTAEHVRWAFSLIKNDVEEKTKLVTSNDREKDNPALAMRAKIASACGRDEGLTLGTLYNRMRGKRKEDVDKVIEAMVKQKLLAREEVVHSVNKTKTYRIRYIGDG